MRILVTGGAGFLGSGVVESLVQNGHEVIVIDNCWRGTKENLRAVLDNITFIEGDACVTATYEMITNPSSVDLVYHLAAINGTKWFHEEPRMVMDVNLNSTLRSLVCRRIQLSLRLHLISRSIWRVRNYALGGDEASVFPVAHEHQRHAYGASKYLGELAVQHAVRQGLDARIVRPFNGYGPRLLGNEYGQVVAMMLQRAVHQGEIIVHGDGSQTRSLTYIDDLVRGLEAAGLVEDLGGMSLNLGSEEECSMLDLAQRIAELVENETGQAVRIRHEQGHPGDSKRRLPNLEQTKKHLNWQAHVTLEDGLGHTLRSML